LFAGTGGVDVAQATVVTIAADTSKLPPIRRVRLNIVRLPEQKGALVSILGSLSHGFNGNLRKVDLIHRNEVTWSTRKSIMATHTSLTVL
jgi:hypothetical protein